MSAATPKARKYLTIPVLMSNGKRKNFMIKTITDNNTFTVGSYKGTTATVTRQTPATKNGTPFID
jgi:hypothetical protein